MDWRVHTKGYAMMDREYTNYISSMDAEILHNFSKLDCSKKEEIICSLMQFLFAQAEAASDLRSAARVTPQALDQVV